MNFKKIVYTAVGCLGLGLGAVGAVVPLLPAFPFLLLAAICFGKSSEKLNDWFLNTRLYKNNLESYIQGRGMTRAAKIRLIITVTVLMSIGFAVLRGIPAGRIALGFIWIFHVLYFMLGVKTIKEGATLEEAAE